MVSNFETVKVFLDTYGWKYEEINQDTILSGFAGESSEFTMIVKISENWVVLSVAPLVERPKPECRINTLLYLASLNFHATLAKFSADENGHIVLTVELPVQGLTQDTFLIALEALCFYAEQQQQTILALANNSNAKPPELFN
jgi:hypothetical protein